MNYIFKKIAFSLILISLVLSRLVQVYANNNEISDRAKKLYILNIIDSEDELDKHVTRAEFSKILVKASSDKDKVVGNILSSIANDVDGKNPYAGYIKIVLEKGYMFTYLGGLFKPNDYVTYSDLSRASLALLGYTDSDFIGNKVLTRNLKFESLRLNQDIDKHNNEFLTKADIINGLYNVLRENIKDSKNMYGTMVFDKLVIGDDKELNVLDVLETKTNGPFIIKNENDINIPFDVNNNNVYINGVKSNIEELKFDIGNYGYAILYFDMTNKVLYSYSERDDILAPIKVKKGYIEDIYYAANDLTTPYRVDIDIQKFMIDNEEMKFAFSPSGSFKRDDYIVIICNKMNDTYKTSRDGYGNVVSGDDESEYYNGSIINAFLYNSIK